MSSGSVPPGHRPEAESRATEVRHNVPRSRYEITVDGRVVGFAEYRRRGNAVVFPHTEIEPSMPPISRDARVLRGSVDDFADEVDRETREPADHRPVDANELEIGPEQDLELA